MDNNLVGKKYTFEDGMIIEIIQIRNKEMDGINQPVVTYHVHNGRSLPRKCVMTQIEFINTYGHLFET